MDFPTRNFAISNLGGLYCRMITGVPWVQNQSEVVTLFIAQKYPIHAQKSRFFLSRGLKKPTVRDLKFKFQIIPQKLRNHSSSRFFFGFLGAFLSRFNLKNTLDRRIPQKRGNKNRKSSWRSTQGTDLLISDAPRGFRLVCRFGHQNLSIGFLGFGF